MTAPALTERLWPTHEAAAITGTTIRQLQYWRVRSLLNPIVEPRGNGRFRWSFDDLLRMMLLRDVVKAGESVDDDDVVREISRCDLTAECLVIAPRVIACTAEQVIDLVHAHSLVTVLPLAGTRAVLCGRIEEFDS